MDIEIINLPIYRIGVRYNLSSLYHLVIKTSVLPLFNIVLFLYNNEIPTFVGS